MATLTLVYQYPLCPCCMKPVNWRSSEFYCHGCKLSWSDEDSDHEGESWTDGPHNVATCTHGEEDWSTLVRRGAES